MCVYLNLYLSIYVYKNKYKLTDKQTFHSIIYIYIKSKLKLPFFLPLSALCVRFYLVAASTTTFIASKNTPIGV